MPQINLPCFSLCVVLDGRGLQPSLENAIRHRALRVVHGTWPRPHLKDRAEYQESFRFGALRDGFRVCRAEPYEQGAPFGRSAFLVWPVGLALSS